MRQNAKQGRPSTQTEKDFEETVLLLLLFLGWGGEKEGEMLPYRERAYMYDYNRGRFLMYSSLDHCFIFRGLGDHQW